MREFKFNIKINKVEIPNSFRNTESELPRNAKILLS